MLKDKQLNIILKSLESSIENLEGYLDKHRNYLCSSEINKILGEIEDYKNTCVQVEGILGNVVIEKMMN